MQEVNWTELKDFLDDRNLSAQYIVKDDQYVISAFDGPYHLICYVDKAETAPDPSDQKDFEDNYKDDANGTYTDGDGSPLQRTKLTKSGWKFFQPFFEYTTAKLNSVYSKDFEDDDTSTVTIKFFKDVSGTETEMSSPTQTDLDNDCIMTQVDWELQYDIDIIGGGLYMATTPNDNVRVWVVAIPDLTPAQGGSIEFLQGLNFKFLQSGHFTNNGRVPKTMPYNATYHTNKFRLIIRHDAGAKCELVSYFELFRQ